MQHNEVDFSSLLFSAGRDDRGDTVGIQRLEKAYLDSDCIILSLHTKMPTNVADDEKSI